MMTTGDQGEFVDDWAHVRRQEIVDCLCNYMDQKLYRTEMILARAQMILEGDFAGFCETEADGTLGRQVSHNVLLNRWVEKHGGRQGWDAFCSRTVRRWAKFIKTTGFTERDKYFLGGTLFEALDTYP